ncbi:MAG TPA: hypothetical protein VFN02_04935 [Ktedonobacteraceae bacterium]|nr:hypothetical protein [Ktedonobacteraceae bacterium]
MMGSTAPNPQQIPALLVDIASGYMKTQALYVATKLGIAEPRSPAAKPSFSRRLSATGTTTRASKFSPTAVVPLRLGAVCC